MPLGWACNSYRLLSSAWTVSTPNLELCCRAISAQRSVRSPALAPYKQRNRGLQIRPGFAVCLPLRWYLITVMHHYSKRASTQRNLKLFNASINETQSLFTCETKLRGLACLWTSHGNRLCNEGHAHGRKRQKRNHCCRKGA